MTKLLKWIAIVALLAVLGIAALIAFGTAAPPAVNTVKLAFSGIDFSALPPVEHYRARDGAALGYRYYEVPSATPSPQVVILIHGASDSGPSLHALAQSLQSAGIRTYVPELRGHGSSRPHGDISYAGQLDDDLMDLVGVVRRRQGNAPLRLAGFSIGGGFALRFAAGPHGSVFERYVLLAPALTVTGPTVRPKTAAETGVRAFAVPYIPRLIGLAAVNAIGIHAFDNLPVLAFAVAPESQTLTRTYTLRLLNNLVSNDYLAALAALKQPTEILIGDADEFSIGSEVARAVHGARPDIPVHILPGIAHLDLVTKPVPIAVIVEWAAAH